MWVLGYFLHVSRHSIGLHAVPPHFTQRRYVSKSRTATGKPIVLDAKPYASDLLGHRRPPSLGFWIWTRQLSLLADLLVQTGLYAEAPVATAFNNSCSLPAKILVPPCIGKNQN